MPTLEFRASLVIGSGSFSFEMIRVLVERLPVMVTPRWVRTPTQPIAVEDVIEYLAAALDLPGRESRVVEIGGADRVTYGGIMEEYARQRGLNRRMFPVPFLTPHLSSLWLGLVTPVYARVGAELIEGLQNPTVVRDRTALNLFDVRPRGIREAIARARRNEDREMARTRWSDGLSSGGATDSRMPTAGEGPASDPGSWTPGAWRWTCRRIGPSGPSAASAVRRAGTTETGSGASGGCWTSWWGGVGSRRGRRDPNALRPGDTVDFRRVEAVDPDRLLRLAAEMKLPGRAWLQFEVEPAGDGAASRIRQTALFDPRGLGGLAYWYALYPLHALGRLLKNVSGPRTRILRVSGKEEPMRRCRSIVDWAPTPHQAAIPWCPSGWGGTGPSTPLARLDVALAMPSPHQQRIRPRGAPNAGRSRSSTAF